MSSTVQPVSFNDDLIGMERRSSLLQSPWAWAGVVVGAVIAWGAWWNLQGTDAEAHVVGPAGGSKAINQAIVQCAEQGGEVRLGVGVYLCTEPIIIRSSRITLRGVGPATELKLADNANCPVLVIGDEANTPRHEVAGVRVADLAIDGNRSRQSGECWNGVCDTGEMTALRNSGIAVRRASDVIVERITVVRSRSAGLVTEKGCRRITVRSLTCSDNEFDGLACYETEDSIFTDLLLHHNPAAGISTDTRFNGNIIANAMLVNNASHGIFMRDSHRNLFQAIVVRNSGRPGVFIDQVDDRADTGASGNSFVGLTVEKTKGAAVRINSANCKGNVFTGTQFLDNEGEISEASPDIAEVHPNAPKNEAR